MCELSSTASLYGAAAARAMQQEIAQHGTPATK
jgi:hypothetical protein